MLISQISKVCLRFRKCFRSIWRKSHIGSDNQYIYGSQKASLLILQRKNIRYFPLTAQRHTYSKEEVKRLLEPKLVDNLKKKISRHNRINAHIYELTAIVVACTRFTQAQATKRIPAWRNGGGCKIPSQSEKILTFDCCEKRKKSISSIV